MLDDCLPMEGDRIGGAQPQKYLETEYDDTEVVQLTDYRYEIGKEIQRRKYVGQRSKRHGLDVGRDRWLTPKPQRQVRVGHQRVKRSRSREPRSDGSPHTRIIAESVGAATSASACAMGLLLPQRSNRIDT